jgi:hemoglobin
MKKELKTRADIELMVDTFYKKVRKDELLGPVFHEVVGEQWSDHMDTMYRFWQTVLLHERTYFDNPFLPHANLPLTSVHFDRWLELFRESLDELFYGEIKEDAMTRSGQMAIIFQSKLQYIHGQK